jgi:Transposase DDE domain
LKVSASDGIIVCMYIATVPNRHSPPAILLRESFREGSKVRTRTLANLTAWAPERIEALRRTLKGEFDGLSGDLPPTCGPIFAVLLVLKQLADRIGLTGVLGKERLAKLALFLVLVRVAAQGSRLSAVRWAANHAVAETLGLGHFDEDDLDAALDALAPRQAQIEDTLYRVSRRQTGQSPTVVLYDVTSSYFEGACNELAAFGYNRDKQTGKAQIVIGLMTTGHGEPLAVHVFDGNTSDPLTVPAQVETLRTRFGIMEVVFVGDRGMIKRKGKTVLATAGYKYITALTTPQVRKLLREGVLRPEWFTSHVHEVQHGPVRLVLRRSEAVRRKAHRRRADKLAKLHALITARNAFVHTAKRAQPAAGLRTLQAWVTRHKLAGWVQLSLQEGDIIATVNEAAQTEASGFDGCYVLETDVPQTVLEAQAVHDRYRDLHEVEQDFRTMKTGLLEVRPIFVRKAPRTRAHVLVTMLALKVVREMRRALVTAFGTTDDDKMAVTVDDALAALSRLCVLIYQVRGTAITRLPSPDARQAAILNALGTPLPGSRSLHMM